MAARVFVTACLLALVASIGPTWDGRAAATPSRQQAVTFLAEPTLIGSTFVQGPVVFTHDDAKMAAGGPCTTVYLLDPEKNRKTEAIASFHCVPQPGKLVSRFTITTRPSTLGYGCVLTSYQFAGDTEVHGVPLSIDAH